MIRRSLPRAAAALVLSGALLAASLPASAAPDERERDARQPRGHVPTGRVVMRFEPSATPVQRDLALTRAGVPRARLALRARDRAVVLPAPGESASAAAVRLAAQPGIRYAAPEGRVTAAGAMVPPNDARYPGQALYLGPVGANPHSIDMQPAWDRAFNGASHTLVPGRAGVKIAIIDSGVNMSFLETTGEYVPVWDYVEHDAITDDDHGHGTRVASVLRAQTANGFHVAGALHASPNSVLVYKVLRGDGQGDTDDALDAIMDAADRGAKVINCSFGEHLTDEWGVDVPGLRAAYTDTVRYAASKGAVVVGAAGNYRSPTSPPALGWALAPGAIPGAICVGAIDPATGALASFSNFGPGDEVDLVAAGIGVWTVDKWGSSSKGDGTSYATPLVSGSLALLWSLASGLPSSTAVSYLLQSGSNHPSKETTSGFGIPRVWNAYQSMIAGVAEQPAVTISPGTPAGRSVTLAWSAAAGKQVQYTYGELGGPTYHTTATSARIVLEDEGARTLWVRSFATDRWSHQSTVSAVVTVPPDGLGALDATRLAGLTRYQTVIEVSRSQFATGAPAVVIASGRNWPDALAAAPLAAAVRGPLLLTDPLSLTIDTRNEIWRLRPSRIFIVGGTAAVDADVRLQLDSLNSTDTVTRLSGADRYETARRIAERLAIEQGDSIPGRRAFVCSGLNYPDALSGAAAAAAAGQPILLTPPTVLSPHTARAISALDITDTVVLGGTSAVSDGVKALLPSPGRIAGTDRYATSRAVADWAFRTGLLDPSSIGVARGDTYPDALAAGGRMSALGGPILLVPTSVDAPLDSWLDARGPSVRGVWVFGGTSAVSLGLENRIRLGLRGQ